MVRALCRLAPALDYATYATEKRRLFREVVTMRPVDGIDALLDALEGETVAKAVASNASRRWVIEASRGIGVHDLRRDRDVRRMWSVPNRRPTCISGRAPDRHRAVALRRDRRFANWIDVGASGCMRTVAIRTGSRGGITTSRAPICSSSTRVS
jgi:hypothetical protein